MSNNQSFLSSFVLGALVFFITPRSEAADDFTIFRPNFPEAAKLLSAPKDLIVKVSEQSVTVNGPMNGRSQSFSIGAGAKPWDLSGYQYVAADVRNAGEQEITIIARAEDPMRSSWDHFCESVVRVGAGKTASVLILLKRKNAPDASLQTLFPGMAALPNGYMPIWGGLDAAQVSRVTLTVETKATALKLELSALRATGICDASPLKQPGYFPFIDAYGQFSHADWPTKIHSLRDFETQKISEAAAMRAAPQPACWDQYGGYADGPKLAATGHFRVEKYNGKWWFVDPAGRLFWSQGITGVGFGGSTVVRGRRQFFSQLPPADEANPGNVNFYLANLKLKYGTNAEVKFAALSNERMHNWGINTLASWTSSEVTDLHQTPYTKMVAIGGAKLAPSLKLPDPFDDSFAPNARRTFEAERATTAKDPWCIGYFIANELEWRGGPEVINEVLTASPKRAGKQALVKMLQQRHGSITNLNVVWHTSYGTWNDLLVATNKVDAKAAVADFTAFNELLAERYYATCETELKRATPDKLNLGSRFHTVNPIAVRAAAQHCDVVSFNKYGTSIRSLTLPDQIDRPIIIGEFHFPAWNRSYTADASRGDSIEKQRADAYWYYVAGAVDNPLVVGTHWFQYLDQPLTGRPDGENWAVGFVDVTDTPYDELTQVSRELGASLYPRRLEAASSSALGAKAAEHASLPDKH